MGIVAGGAVLTHGGVFPEHRAALFLVAGITIFVHRGRLQKAGARSSMGIVAVNTEDPSLLEGMMARHGKLRLNRLMAGKTQPAGVPRRDF